MTVPVGPVPRLARQGRRGHAVPAVHQHVGVGARAANGVAVAGDLDIGTGRLELGRVRADSEPVAGDRVAVRLDLGSRCRGSTRTRTHRTRVPGRSIRPNHLRGRAPGRRLRLGEAPSVTPGVFAGVPVSVVPSMLTGVVMGGSAVRSEKNGLRPSTRDGELDRGAGARVAVDGVDRVPERTEAGQARAVVAVACGVDREDVRRRAERRAVRELRRTAVGRGRRRRDMRCRKSAPLGPGS